MHFTLWPSRTANKGGHAEISWEDFREFVASPQVAEAKDSLEGWSPVRFEGNRRAKSACELVSAIVLDDDASGLPTDKIAEIWAPYAGVVHTSHSHTLEAPKHRIVLPLSRDVSSDEHARVWAYVRFMAASRGQTLDEATKDPSRLWYVPAHRAGAAYTWRELKGAPLDADEILRTSPAVEAGRPSSAAPALAPRAPAAGAAEGRRRAQAVLAAAWPVKGTRHDAKLALSGALAGDGWPEADALEFMAAMPTEDPSKLAPDVRSSYQAAVEGKPCTGWTRLEAYVGKGVVSEVRKMLSGNAAIEQKLAEVGAKYESKTPAAAGPFPLTDSGNAERFAAQHAERVRFVADWNRWLTWDGTRWQSDKTGAVARLAKETARAINGEIELEDDDDRRKKVRAWASKSEGRQGRENMIALARSEQGIAAVPQDFDADPWLLNAANGTLDLRTMKLRPHAREDMITKLAPVAYDPDAKAPLWDAFLHRVMAGNADLIGYLQRLAGYALTGSIREQIFAFSYGGGRNGKGVFHHTLDKMLGDYAATAADNLFFVSKGDGGHPTSTASLFGARFVLCSEIPDDKRFNEQLLKNMTGNDTVTTRRLYENEWEYKPTFKLFFCGNHKPQIRGLDDAIWRRVRLIPWAVQIPKDEVDTELETKLEAELSGVLAWAARGCAAWLKQGLGDPPDVEQATAGYREESDPMSEFFRTRCEFGGEFKVSRSALRRSYEAWCAENGATPFGPKKVGEALRRRGVVDGGLVQDRLTGDRVNAWRGVRLLETRHVAA